MLGYAWQKGRVPLSHAALMRAIELNGVQIENNKAAFEWGRRAAHDLAAVTGAVQAGAGDRVRQEAVDSDETDRASASSSSPATRTPPMRRSTRPSSTRCAPPRRRWASTQADRGGGALPVQADGLQGRVRGRAPAHRPRLPRPRSTRMFEGDYKLNYHLAPPLIAQDATPRASCVKQQFGPWMLTGFRRAGQAEGPARHARSTSSAAPRSAGPSAR